MVDPISVPTLTTAITAVTKGSAGEAGRQAWIFADELATRLTDARDAEHGDNDILRILGSHGHFSVLPSKRIPEV